MSLVNVAMSKWIIDVATGAQEGNIYLVATIVALSFLLGMGIKLVSPWIFGKINMRISIRMQNSLSDALMMCSWKGAGKWHTGDLLTRISSDASEVLGMGMGILPNLLVTGLQLASSFIYLWILDARLAWFILGVTPLVLLSKIYFRKVRELSCAQKKMNSEMGTVMQENLSKRILVRSLGATNYRKQKLHETQEKLFKLGMEQIKFSTFTQGVMGFTFGGGYLCAFLWGIFQLHNHEITFGTMTAFLQLVGQVQGPFLGLISIPPSLIRGWTSVERLMALFEDVEPDEHPVYIDQPLTLNFRKVSFGYEEGRDLGEALRRINEGASMIRTKGEPGTGDIVQAVRHMRKMNSEIAKLTSMREDELFEAAKNLQVPFELVKFVHDNGKLPVVNFAAGGVATPADAALMMQLGAEGVFVGSGIFKSGDPAKRAAAIVKAVTNFTDAKLIAELSEDLGEAMVGINESEIKIIMEERGK